MRVCSGSSGISSRVEQLGGPESRVHTKCFDRFWHVEVDPYRLLYLGLLLRDPS